MNKHRLIEFIKKPTDIGSSELKTIEVLAANFPYCQFLKALSARGHKNCRTEQQDKRIALAAVYQADRSILKHFMQSESFEGVSFRHTTEADIIPVSATRVPSKKVRVYEDEPKKEILEKQTFVEKEVPITYKKEEEKEIYKEIQDNLEELRKHRALIESLEEGTEISKEKRESQKDGLEIAKEEIQYYIPEEEEDKIIAELSSKDEVQQDLEKEEKQKQQFEIIDRFIQTNPSIARFGLHNKPVSEEQEDLSERFIDQGNQLVSENLAIILTKQNKIDKAIDIYKKLIWKFPQKKAYFAQKIEELKKI